MSPTDPPATASPTKLPFFWRHPLLNVWLIFTFGIIATIACALLIFGPGASVVAWLAWQLTPWRSFPYPASLANVIQGPDPHDAIQLGVLFIASLICGTLATLGHCLTFGIVLCVHRRWGRPAYWSDIAAESPISLAWIRSAKHSMGLLALVMVGSMLATALGSVLFYLRYPAIWILRQVLVLHVAAVVVGWTIYSSRCVQTHIIRVVRADRRRCRKCNYALRGLKEHRCPECGNEFDPAAPVDYGIRTRAPRTSTRTRAVLTGLLLLVLLAPAWIPRVVMLLPRASQSKLPDWLRAIPYLSSDQRTPVCTAGICVIRNPAGTGLVRFAASGYRVNYAALFIAKDGPAPTVAQKGAIKPTTNHQEASTIEVGPLSLRAEMEVLDLVFIFPRNADCTIGVYESCNLPAEYRQAAESLKP